MAATKSQIRAWLLEAKQTNATHVIIVCDTFDWEDYPVNVWPGEDARGKAKDQNGQNMQRVMEVYNLSMDIDKQLEEKRAFNYDS